MPDPTDPERIAACARAMGWTLVPPGPQPGSVWAAAHYTLNGNLVLWAHHYNPFHDKAQAFDLVERLRLTIEPFTDGDWQVSKGGHWQDCYEHTDLLRAIVVCASDAQLAKEKARG